MITRTKKYIEDQKYYILDLSKLELGDVILENGDSLVSPLIKLATQSEFSHVKCYWSYASIIDATLSGVHSYNVRRTLYSSPRNVKVLRYKGNLSPEVQEKIVFSIREKIGCPYSKWNALSSVVGLLRNENRKGQFCSKLIAMAYIEAGVKFSKEIQPEYFKPSDFEYLEDFVEVDNCVVEAEIKDINFANSPSMLDKQIEATNYIIKKASEVSQQEFYSLNEVNEFLKVNKEYDESFCSVLIQSGYLDLTTSLEVPKNRYRYNDEAFNNYTKSCTSENIIEEYHIQKELAERFSINYKNSCANLLNTGLKYFYLLQDLYKNLLDLHSSSARRFENYAKANKIYLCVFPYHYSSTKLCETFTE